jgi:hypothetical protein
MLILFCLHILITVVSSLSGFLFYCFLKDKNALSKPTIFYPLTGLVALSLVSQVAVLFIPIDLYFFVGVLCVLIFLSFLKKKEVRQFVKNIRLALENLSVYSLIFIAVVWLMIVILNSGPIIMDDTESYHLQMIKWIHEYGTVPGIANLHERFGFNSSWFSLVSFFTPFDSTHNLYTALNGAVSFWIAAFLISQLNPISGFQKNQRITSFPIVITVLFLVLIFCWPMVRGNSVNANYDFIASAMILILFTKAIDAGKQRDSGLYYLEWILWPVFLFTVRIINFPLLLLSVYGFYFLLKNRAWKKIVIVSAISLTLLISFLARNVMLSGYPFYPSMFADIFPVDWKVDRNTIKNLLEFIKYYNRISTHFSDLSNTKQLSSPGWILSWFHYLFSYDKLVVVLGVAGYVINLIAIKRFFGFHNRGIRFFVFVFCLQLVSWMCVAPDPRFVYGELLAGVALLLIFFVGNLSLSTGSIRSVSLLMILFGGIFVYALLKPLRSEDYRHFLLPYSIPQPPTREVVVDSISLKIPEKILNNWNPRCYATELPCLYIVSPKLRARGKDIKNGFRLEK